MNVEQLLALIPEQELEFLAAETKVDHQVKKLDGIIMFRLILFSMLNTQRVSYRVMESFFHSAQFKSFATIGDTTTRFSSIRDRVSTIKAEFFHGIFIRLFELFNAELNEQNAIIKVDSTFIAISAKLVNWSLQKGGNNEQLRHVKYGIGMKGSLPCHVQIYTEQNASSDDIALPDTIQSILPGYRSIVTFDRGVQSRKAFQNFSEKKILFVGRLNLPVRYQLISMRELPLPPENNSVLLSEDLICSLQDRKQRWTKEHFRIISGTIVKTQQPICFISNSFELSAYEIAAVYKQRWQIEVFIKFLKQHLNLSHLHSRNGNGMKVMIYMTMILAILILVFKKKKKIGSYKIAKLQFEIGLENLIIKDIVILCGGNPDRAAHLWNSS